jgi:serine/threonine protein kinase
MSSRESEAGDTAPNLQFVGIVFSPTFRICVACLLCLMYVIQIATHANDIDNTKNSEGEDSYDRLESSFLAIDVLLLVTAMVQILSAWRDYQSFEHLLLKSNACLFGLTCGSLVMSGMSEELHSSSFAQALYALNILAGLWLSFVDLLDLRTIGLERHFDLVGKDRDRLNSISGDRSGSSTNSGSESGSTLSSPGATPSSSTKMLPGAALVNVNGERDIEMANMDKDGNNNNNNNDNHSFRKVKGPTTPASYLPSSTFKTSILHNDDITDGFRVRLDRLSEITVGRSNKTIMSDIIPPPASGESSNGMNILDADSIDLKTISNTSTMIERKNVRNIPVDVSWDSFSFIEHRIDSSSCHIYTAMWENIPVIIKLIKADRITSPVAVAEFEAEAAVLSCVDHPHVVNMLGSGFKPRRFIILELLDGGSMSHSLGLRPDSLNRTRKRKFSFLETLTLSRDLASALDYLHNRCHEGFKIIHRDLKPDNIGWTSDGTIKLFDFGLCAVVKADDAETGKGYHMTGNTGTLRYMAPEVAMNRPYHSSVDAYSFSIVVWQVLTGTVPFREMGKRKYFDKVVHGGYRPSMSRSHPKKFRELLERCWHTDKNRRPDFREIVDELTDLLIVEHQLESTGWRRVQNFFLAAWKALKRALVKVRPLFMFIFFVIAIASMACIGQGKIFAATGTAIVSSGGLYLTTVSITRYHLRKEGNEGKKAVNTKEDLLHISVGLESGKGASFDHAKGITPLNTHFSFNPISPSQTGNELYGLQ